MPLFSPYSERRRSMTTDEKNKILQMIREDLPRREIARLTGFNPATIIRFERNIDNVLSFASCPVCGKEIINYKNQRGRKRQYCSDKCYNSKKRRKDKVCTCLNCGKSFLAWRFTKTKYCCYSCFVQHKYGKRLQNKSS